MPIVADNYNVNNATKGDHRKIRPSDLALLLNPQAQEFGVLAFTIAERKFAEAGDGRKGKGLKAFGVPWSDIDGWAHRQLEDSYFQLGLPTTDQVRKLYAHEIASSFASWGGGGSTKAPHLRRSVRPRRRVEEKRPSLFGWDSSQTSRTHGFWTGLLEHLASRRAAGRS